MTWEMTVQYFSIAGAIYAGAVIVIFTLAFLSSMGQCIHYDHDKKKYKTDWIETAVDALISIVPFIVIGFVLMLVLYGIGVVIEAVI